MALWNHAGAFLTWLSWSDQRVLNWLHESVCVCVCVLLHDSRNVDTARGHSYVI